MLLPGANRFGPGPIVLFLAPDFAMRPLLDQTSADAKSESDVHDGITVPVLKPSSVGRTPVFQTSGAYTLTACPGYSLLSAY